MEQIKKSNSIVISMALLTLMWGALLYALPTAHAQGNRAYQQRQQMQQQSIQRQNMQRQQQQQIRQQQQQRQNELQRQSQQRVQQLRQSPINQASRDRERQQQWDREVRSMQFEYQRQQSIRRTERFMEDEQLKILPRLYRTVDRSERANRARSAAELAEKQALEELRRNTKFYKNEWDFSQLQTHQDGAEPTFDHVTQRIKILTFLTALSQLPPDLQSALDGSAVVTTAPQSLSTPQQDNAKQVDMPHIVIAGIRLNTPLGLPMCQLIANDVIVTKTCYTSEGFEESNENEEGTGASRLLVQQPASASDAALYEPEYILVYLVDEQVSKIAFTIAEGEGTTANELIAQLTEKLGAPRSQVILPAPIPPHAMLLDPTPIGIATQWEIRGGNLYFIGEFNNPKGTHFILLESDQLSLNPANNDES